MDPRLSNLGLKHMDYFLDPHCSGLIVVSIGLTFNLLESQCFFAEFSMVAFQTSLKHKRVENRPCGFRVALALKFSRY